ncbi:MAG: PCRF domain-containing protein, partial [Phycisphaerales bacterium]|nr:PCRF domain-containing protein [Phycisphaerales bacterium]
MTQSTLTDKLDELDRRFSEIGEQMNDPAIASDGIKIVALSKEHAALSRIVTPYRAFTKLAAARDEAQEILDDPDSDPEYKELAHEEIDELRHKTDDALEEVKGLLVMGDDADVGSVIMELRAGTGGDEAALFCGDLLEMYRRYAEQHHWKFEIMDGSPTEMGGYKDVTINIRGEGVWARLGYEGGGHRVQRVPKTESQGRVHTSAATVAVLPEPE